MFGGLNRLLAAAVVAAAILVVPPAALASGCGGGPSAVQVYKECLPNGGGGGKGGTPATGGQGSTPAISAQTAAALAKAGKGGKALKRLVEAYGMRRVLQSSHETAAPKPTAIGSAFDLGSGPTAILIILAGTAIVLLAATGARGWRRSHRS